MRLDDWDDEAIDLPYELRNTPERAGLSLVACIDNGGGYNWANFYIFRAISDDRLYWWTGTGCSCDQPLDGVNVLADLTQGTERDLVTDLYAFASDQWDTDYLHSHIAAMQSDWFKQINAIAERQK